jgi:hypothetical protein
MPTVLLTRYECQTGRLPRLCARCGEPADDGIPFPLLTPVPHFLLNLFLVICPPVFVVLAVTVLRRRTFVLPLCAPDRADWEWRDRVSSWTYVALVCGVYLAAPVLGYLLWVEADDEIGIVLGFLVYYLTWVAWVMPVAVLWTRTVRSSKVTMQGVRLAGVCAAFVTALRADRAQDADPARLPWRGDERDDYDDQPD